MASNGIATAVVAGNLTRDPELNESGKVLRLGVAVSRYEKQSSEGEYQDVSHFFDVKVLGNRAEALHRILSKGSKVTVLGDLVHERWENKEGEKRSAVRILAREVVIGGDGKPAEPEASAEGGEAPW